MLTRTDRKIIDRLRANCSPSPTQPRPRMKGSERYEAAKRVALTMRMGDREIEAARLRSARSVMPS